MGSGNSTHRVFPCRVFVIGIIDVQNDFCKDGKLAVSEAGEAIAAINKLRYMYDDRMGVFLSQDWHHMSHMSFAETHKKTAFSGPEKLNLIMPDGTTAEVEQMMWPRHCVEYSDGAKFHPDLIRGPKDFVVKKGTRKNVESYSAFGDALQGKYEKTQLDEWLRQNGVSDIILTGLATDYCVYNTALDAVRLKYNVHLILSCTRGVAKDSVDKALDDLKTKGVLCYDTVNAFYETHKFI